MSEQGQGTDKPSGNEPEKTSKGEEAGAEEVLKASAEEMIRRRSRWQSSLAALRYVSSVSRDHEVKIRETDRITSLFLVLVLVFALLCLVLPAFAPLAPEPFAGLLSGLAQLLAPLAGLADVLVGFALLLYVANRFGIVTTLTPRQALLTWQLMLGSSLLGVFMAINLGLAIAYVVANTPPITLQQR